MSNEKKLTSQSGMIHRSIRIHQATRIRRPTAAARMASSVASARFGAAEMVKLSMSQRSHANGSRRNGKIAVSAQNTATNAR